jgi:hypothetical protein
MNNTSAVVFDAPGTITIAGSVYDASDGVTKMTIRKSSNDGITWDQHFINNASGQLSSLVIHPTERNVLFAGGVYYDSSQSQTRGGLFTSADTGSTWTELGQSVFNDSYNYIYSICFDPFNTNRILVGAQNGMYISTNGGTNWTKINSIYYNVVNIIAIPARQGCFFAGTSNGVMVSTDSGTTWESLSNGLPNMNITALSYDGIHQTLYAGTYSGGVNRLDVLSIVSIEQKDHENLPTQFDLSQNYPNPFNPATRIEYSIPKRGLYRLEVFNVLGQKVATLVDEDCRTGRYSTSFDASEISSGVYYYSLTGEGTILTRKMVVLK